MNIPEEPTKIRERERDESVDSHLLFQFGLFFQKKNPQKTVTKPFSGVLFLFLFSPVNESILDMESL